MNCKEYKLELLFGGREIFTREYGREIFTREYGREIFTREYNYLIWQKESINFELYFKRLEDSDGLNRRDCKLFASRNMIKSLLAFL